MVMESPSGHPETWVGLSAALRGRLLSGREGLRSFQMGSVLDRFIKFFQRRCSLFRITPEGSTETELGKRA